MKWIEERDALIAQTKAFVEAVTRKSADAAGSGARAVHRTPVVEPNSAASLTAAPAAKPTAPTARPSEPTREAASKPAAPPASAPAARRYDHVSMSTEIRARIAAFRAHQERFNRERHEYFNATLARLRAELDELPPLARGGSGQRPDTA